MLQANSSVTSSPGPFLGTPGEEGGVGLGAPHSLDSRAGTVWGGRVLLVEDQSVGGQDISWLMGVEERGLITTHERGLPGLRVQGSRWVSRPEWLCPAEVGGL